MQATDEQLMTRYCDGDGVAFEALYRRHRGPVYRYVQRLAAADMDAEALYQDAWMRVIESRLQWRRDQPFKPWLYRIAHNLMANWHRDHSRRQVIPLDEIALATQRSPIV